MVRSLRMDPRRLQLVRLWLLCSGLRFVQLAIHYLRDDPFGRPIVARVDRFLWLSFVVEAGAIAVLLSPLALAGLRFRTSRLLRVAWGLSAAYLMFATLDLEVYRWLRQHVTLSYLLTYVRPGIVADATFQLSWSVDPLGMGLAFGFCALYLVALLLSGRVYRSAPPQQAAVACGVLFLAAGTLGTSQLWLNPSNNRFYRLMPPLYVIGAEVGRAVEDFVYEPDLDAIEPAMARLGLRPDGFDFPRAGFPLVRVPKASSVAETTPNLVVIIGESFHRDLFLEQLGRPDRLVNVRRLTEYGGILFENAISNSFPSVAGAASIYLSLWNHPTDSIFSYYAAHNFRGWPDYLDPAVYRRYVVSGADPYFDNQAPWFHRWYDRMIYDRDNAMGVYDSDRVVVDQALELMAEHPVGTPYLLTINTHSTHAPYRTPDDHRPDWPTDTDRRRFERALDFFDRQLGRLLDGLEARPDFEDTVFIVIGDHAMAVTDDDFAYPELYGFQRNRTIAAVLSPDPGRFGGRLTRSSRVVSQLDIGPTIVDLLGLAPATHFLGHSLLSEPAEAHPQVFLQNNTFSVHAQPFEIFGHLREDIVWQRHDDGTFEELTTSSPLWQWAEDVKLVAPYLGHLIRTDRVWPSFP